MTEQTEGAETFRGYIDAEAAATRSFIAYKFGEVSEAEVHRLQRIAHAARERHLAALAAAEVRGAQAVLAAVEAIHLPIHDQVCATCRVLVLPCPTLTAARAAAAAAGGGGEDWHLVVNIGDGVTVCCGRAVTSLPPSDGLTEDAAMATCAGADR